MSRSAFGAPDQQHGQHREESEWEHKKRLLHRPEYPQNIRCTYN